IALLERNVDFELRETLESALVFGREGLVRLGADRDEAAEIEREVRSLDAERLAVQRVEGIYAGSDRYRVVPVPLTKPRRTAVLGDTAGE
ncbi:MAG TPA: potassium transporter, partial [Arenibaculum sp.]|nr:potassium transporter [Arenibaculum sp.]